MAPALVEHSAAKERNSISKEYSKSCWSQFDIELYKFVNSFETKTLPVITRNSSYLEMNNSGKKERQDISFAENKNAMVSFKDIPIITFPNLKGITYDAKTGYKNGTLNYKFEKMPVNANAESACVYSSKGSTTRQDCITMEDRPPHPVASMPDNLGVANYLQMKKDSCGTKFSNLNKSMDKLNQRLKQLQSKNVFAHVSAHVNKRDKCVNSKSNNNSTESNSKGILPGINIDKPWEDLRKLHDMVSFQADDTDCEDDLEIHHGWQNTVGRRKKKSDNPPPPTEALHQWNIQRAYIGSQCSWLSLKISLLDTKISQLDELREKHRLVRKNSQTDIRHDDEPDADPCGNKDEVNVPDVEDDQICRRVLPFTNIRQHEYIKVKQNTSTPAYGCRCLPSVTPCYRCLHSQKHSPKDSRTERTGKLDGGFHSRLSYENEVSLSFLMEEALRKQRINTKVTISKPTKKKKKQKIKEGTGNNELSEKQPAVSKSSKHTSEKNHLRSRNERQKYDELPRKRSSALEPSGHSGRSRKSRKLSESEESWKPSTPTELNSPFSQNLSSSAFFPLKRKKNSSGTDYDINNIVIPYSMAASTRVERIQYKEIPTPGWRNANRTFNELVDSEEYETTDDEAYLERHMRCEVNEKKKFTDYYQPVLRRRPYHLSESTASGPPSPLVNEELRPTVTTPIDSPVINSSTLLSNRLTNLIVVSDEERESSWAIRTYPLNPSECENLSVVTTSSVNTPSDSKPIISDTTTTKHLPATTNSHSSTQHSSKCSNSTNNVPVSVTPHETPLQTPLQTPPLPTPLHTPVETPMPSPLCSPAGGTLSGADGTVRNGDPNNWTVKEDTLDAVDTETQQRTGGIVLKLAKK